LAWPRGAALRGAALRFAGRVDVPRLAVERAEVDGRVAMLRTVRDRHARNTCHTRDSRANDAIDDVIGRTADDTLLLAANSAGQATRRRQVLRT
jgi:hypothetical protein